VPTSTSTPQWRLIGNVNVVVVRRHQHVLEYLRNQGNISRFIGTDISAAVQYRPSVCFAVASPQACGGRVRRFTGAVGR
jgi:hypothetical protein